MSAIKKIPLVREISDLLQKKPASFPSRAERVALVPLHNVRFLLNIENGKKEFRLKNLSTTGMALIYDEKEASLWSSTEGPLTGTLELSDKATHVVSIEIRHRGPSTLGCQFQHTDYFFQRSIRNHLFAELLGLGLQKINPEILHKEEGQDSFWFADVHQNGLHFSVGDGQITHAEIYFLGHTLMMNLAGQLRQIETSVDEASEIREMAIKLIKSIKDLPEVHREHLCQILEDHQTPRS